MFHAHQKPSTTDPSGIRFGSSEIYSLIEAPPFTTSITNTLCIGRRRPHEADEDVFLFIVMKPPHSFTPALRNAIKSTIRKALSPRHVPRFIVPVPDVPVTINGKKVESAVKEVMAGKEVRASQTVVNPEVIGYFKRFRDWEGEEGEEKGLKAKL